MMRSDGHVHILCYSVIGDDIHIVSIDGMLFERGYSDMEDEIDVEITDLGAFLRKRLRDHNEALLKLLE